MGVRVHVDRRVVPSVRSMLCAKSVRQVVLRIVREEIPKRRQPDFPGRRSLVALHDDSVVLASSNVRSDPFGTVFPIGLGEPWGTDSRGLFVMRPYSKVFSTGRARDRTRE